MANPQPHNNQTIHPLDERKQMILRAIVDDYIETAQPVGSKSLVNRYQLAISSATIRNEMSELEELGYLEQPHTSAGRVPTDKGYRAYVDELLPMQPLPYEEAERMRAEFDTEMVELTDLIRKAASVLSEHSGYTSMVLSPNMRQSFLQQIKMLMIEPGRALVVVVLSAGRVKDRIVRIPEVLDAGQLMQLANAIEEGLAGRALDDITFVTVQTAARGIALPESLLNQILFEAYVSIKQAENLELYLDGQHNVLSFPEFQNLQKARGYLDALARDGMIAGYLHELDPDPLPERSGSIEGILTPAGEKRLDSSAYMIRIGQEIMLEGLDDCSFVTTTYTCGDTMAGRIGVLGPRRMAYGKVISQISFLRQTISSRLTGRDCAADQEKGQERIQAT